MEQEKRSGMTTPLSSRGIPAWGVYLAAFLGLIYLLNPGAGVLELIPDNIPLVGNLDEGAAALLIWYGLLELLEGRKERRRSKEAASRGPRGA